LLNFADKDRATLSFIVQILSSSLGAVNMYVVRELANYYIRLKLTRKWIGLDRFAFWSAICAASPNFNLPWGLSALTILAYLFALAQAALWAGAITPTETLRNCSIDAVGAQFSQESKAYWDIEFKFVDGLTYNYPENCYTKWLTEGLFTTCPVPALNGFLLTAAEESSDNLTAKAKFDSSGYTYTGRNYGVGYGVGTSRGLRAQDLHAARVQSYSFIETGYDTTINCAKNLTSALYFVQVEEASTNDTPNVVDLSGYLPNSFPGSGAETYPIATWRTNEENMTAWAALHNPNDGTNFLTIAAGPGKYVQFNQTQCQIIFTPREFRVDVNVTSRSFIVTPQISRGNVTDPEPTGNLTAAVVRSINLLSRMTSGLYVSEVGEALVESLEGLMMETNKTDGAINDDMILTSVSSFLMSMVDGVLSAYSNGQVHIANDIDVLNITNAQCTAVRLGADKYIYGVFALNLFIVIVVLLEATRRKAWAGLPSWDLRSVEDIVTSCMASSTSKDYDAVQWIALTIAPPKVDNQEMDRYVNWVVKAK
jgi:hypothetical protein